MILHYLKISETHLYLYVYKIFRKQHNFLVLFTPCYSVEYSFCLSFTFSYLVILFDVRQTVRIHTISRNHSIFLNNVIKLYRLANVLHLFNFRILNKHIPFVLMPIHHLISMKTIIDVMLFCC